MPSDLHPLVILAGAIDAQHRLCEKTEGLWAQQKAELRRLEDLRDSLDSHYRELASKEEAEDEEDEEDETQEETHKASSPRLRCFVVRDHPQAELCGAYWKYQSYLNAVVDEKVSWTGRGKIPLKPGVEAAAFWTEGAARAYWEEKKPRGHFSWRS